MCPSYKYYISILMTSFPFWFFSCPCEICCKCEWNLLKTDVKLNFTLFFPNSFFGRFGRWKPREWAGRLCMNVVVFLYELDHFTLNWIWREKKHFQQGRWEQDGVNKICTIQLTVTFIVSSMSLGGDSLSVSRRRPKAQIPWRRKHARRRWWFRIYSCKL